MPKRIIDGEAMWTSTKLEACPEWVRVEYAWLYPLADCNGSFEISSITAIWRLVYTIRPHFSCPRLREALAHLEANGLLFTWEANGKRYAHWTNSDRPGRLPRPADRYKYERLAPPVPADKLAEFLSKQQNSISPQQRDNSAIKARMGFGVGVGVGLGVGSGGGEGFGFGAPKGAAQPTAATPAAASPPPSETIKTKKTEPAHVLDPDESLRAEAERQKAELQKKFWKGKPHGNPKPSAV